MPIVLKNHAAVNVPFSYAGDVPNGRIFSNSGPLGLLDRKRLTTTILETKGAYRVRFKLEQPSVCDQATDCTNMLNYTQVGSADISVVKTGKLLDRQDMVAYIKSFTATAEFAAMVIDVTVPTS